MLQELDEVQVDEQRPVGWALAGDATRQRTTSTINGGKAVHFILNLTPGHGVGELLIVTELGTLVQDFL
ncbi:MAG: hypothetical protein AAGC60_17765 [Acidobacteriota bacterium]